MNDKTKLPNAGFRRRIGAIIYDAILLLAIFIVSSFFIIPMTGIISADNIFYPFFLYLEVAVFYIYFWCRNGQTLGMQTWRIELIDDKGARIDAATATLRFAVATLSLVAAGLGFLWALTNRERLMFHDVASDSRVVFLGKPTAKKKKDAGEDDSEGSARPAKQDKAKDKTDGDGNQDRNKRRKAKNKARR